MVNIRRSVGSVEGKKSSITGDKPATRTERKRIKTRARLLSAAHEVMADIGVDAATVLDITELADVGFGTFYNYFTSKTDLAAQVLDCVINDMGRRNDIATKDLKVNDPAKVMPVSIRLFLREAVRDPMWRWWVKHPELLVDRMRYGFRIFAIRDMENAVEQDLYNIAGNNLEIAWLNAAWMMIGCIHEMTRGNENKTDIEPLVIESILRVMGVSLEQAHDLARGELPDFPPPSVDFGFIL